VAEEIRGNEFFTIDMIGNRTPLSHSSSSPTPMTVTFQTSDQDDCGGRSTSKDWKKLGEVLGSLENEG
jgi:hypothetical protein